MRDAFGLLLTDPAELDLPGRVDVLRRLAGELQAGPSREARWLGSRLSAWLATGGNLERTLGVRPARGSRTTAAALVLAERRRIALLQLVGAVGCDALAVRLLRGSEPCPAKWLDLVEEARALRCAMSRDGIRRARSAARHRA